MEDREKLIELISDFVAHVPHEEGQTWEEACADHLLANGVTVQEHGYWETVVEVRDHTVCGNGVKIEYKRCSCCKTPAKFLKDDFCRNCGAKLDLPEPSKGE